MYVCQAHYHRVFQARFSPDQICFITHDATLAFPIPRFARRQLSSMNRAHKLELGVTGLTNFSAQLGNYFYHFKHKFSKNCDLVISEWYLHLQALKMSKLPSSKAKVLVLELDNCVGDNKNIYVFAFLSIVIYWGWFECVFLTFLVEGHTHNQQDATHSAHNVGLRSGVCTNPINLIDHYNRIFGTTEHAGKHIIVCLLSFCNICYDFLMVNVVISIIVYDPSPDPNVRMKGSGGLMADDQLSEYDGDDDGSLNNEELFMPHNEKKHSQVLIVTLIIYYIYC